MDSTGTPSAAEKDRRDAWALSTPARVCSSSAMFVDVIWLGRAIAPGLCWCAAIGEPIQLYGLCSFPRRPSEPLGFVHRYSAESARESLGDALGELGFQLA